MAWAAKSARGSVALKSRRGGNMEKDGETRWEFSLEEKYNPCLSFTMQVVTKRPCVLIGPYGLFCLAASRSKVTIVFETEEVKWDQQECASSLTVVCICFHMFFCPLFITPAKYERIFVIFLLAFYF